MQLSVDYKKFTKLEIDTLENDLQTTVNLIMYAGAQIYAAGFPSGGERRIYGRLQRKMENAAEVKASFFEIEQAEVDVVKKLVKNCNFKPEWAKYIICLEDALDALGHQAEKQVTQEGK